MKLDVTSLFLITKVFFVFVFYNYQSDFKVG